MLHNPYNNHYYQVPNPQTPFHGGIPNGLVEGKQININGEVVGDHFKINFYTPDGTALHFNPRLDQGCVVRNTKCGDSYGHEEKEGPQPFEYGQRYEMIFKVTSEHFLIAVNGQHCFEYQHRIPFEDVHELEVTGDFHVSSIVFAGGHHHRHNKHAPSHVPFALPIHDVRPGKMIQVLGEVLPHANKFKVNLQDGEGHDGDSENIALHLSVRLNDHIIVANNKECGDYGAEVRTHHFPFHHEQSFELLFLCEDDEWKVAVNGHHLMEMGHRNPFYHANHIAVHGDVVIKSIREY